MIPPLPLLRAPPFPWADATVSNFAAGAAAQIADPSAMFAAVGEARVGGRFWADPAGLTHPAGTVLRPRTIAEISTLRRANAVWIAPFAGRSWAGALAGEEWRGDVDPWSVLRDAQALAAHGDDEWIVLARVMGASVEVLSPGRFGVPGDDGGTLDRLAAQALGAAIWRDPFTGEPSTMAAAVELLGSWRTVLDANRPIVAACGMAWWKRKEISHFLWHPQRPLRIVSASARALSIARKADGGTGGAVAIWPSRVSPALTRNARAQGTALVQVEDGFVRSVGLGVDLVPPSSVVVDALGIHFDPAGPSDLEKILNNTETPPRLLERAAALRETIVAAGISKYSAGTVSSVPERQPGKRLILVPAQVADDMSVIAGGGELVARAGLGANLELLRRVRAAEPDAEIWFRPHPDVDAGHRKGAVPDAEVLAFADRIVRGGGMAPLLDAVDAVHVLTSLTGFEALMRGREVICHGAPFYAGWGLTRDLGEVPKRRTRKLSLDALVAGVLILYPRYLDPVTGLPCPPEVLVRRMATSSAPNRLGWIAPLRRWQGKLMSTSR
ncbi:capsule biosynthesis protein [Novosphingobium sp. P6W]|uniref:capsular polysaccharide export protein, LipB/KpsS family n=1 Tax=Novosphingobium sp. P6W TaxID=1609758 RepID=UPI0005C2B0FA|nr:capsule biosynthesis protein [Novosphingobium sp. P6W]AXB80687.1 beta-3-deoxy-D-manno-oct-2-ulosonic acid transferase [Novosphingobium sp. P6W]KIS29506.1 capsule biosynthesis protein [Novosphingobium sp. P6W]